MHGTVPWMTVTPLCPPSPARCRYDASVIDEHFYFVEDKKFKIVYAEKYLSLSCPENATLESVSMPRFERMVRVQHVELTACVPPAGPYARALARLNISALDLLVLARPRGALRPHHFDGINVSALFIRGSEPIQLERGTLASLYALLDLRLERVSLTDSDLMEMPVGLRRLSISSCNVSLPRSALDRLQELMHVVVREPRLHQAPDLRAVASLRDAVFVAPLDVVPMSTSLENVTVWSAQRLEFNGGYD
ncbi:unnamed protein product [Parnassius apollo]|uniref:(apollo) hypothetical protein n=1 Tax=Parnassius apollo TaxID=110799 RepID=A0A8S3WLD4_PARAO|nr:unnamed protein product [Parnassius apollo]